MKTSLLTATAAALILGLTAVSCASTGGKSSASGSSTSISSGSDMFAGHTFTSKGQKLEFGKDKTITSYVFVADRNQWVKESKSTYTFDAKTKTLSSKMTSLFVNGAEFKNVNEVIAAYYPAVESEYKKQFEKLKMDKASQNNLLAISKQQIKDLYSLSFNHDDKFTYNFSKNGKTLTLKQVINKDLSYSAMNQFRGQDQTGKYQLVLSNYLANMAVVDPKTNTIAEGSQFQGNCVIDDKTKTFTTDLYRITVKLDKSGKPLSETVAKAGKLSASYELTGFVPNEEAQKQGFDVYNGTYVLTVKQAPKGLEALKTLYIPCAFQSYSVDYTRE
ncbi:MAG: hypothetical protein IKP51_11685 [Treponema sp.]|nr:hypothetical protein [Treponema sp.]